MNPFSAAQRKLTAELEQLREENRRLTKRLQLVEESRAVAVSDLSARVDSELHASAGKEVEGIMKYDDGYMHCCFIWVPGCYVTLHYIRVIVVVVVCNRSHNWSAGQQHHRLQSVV